MGENERTPPGDQPHDKDQPQSPATSGQARPRRGWLIGVAVLALIGWIAAYWLATSRSAIEEELTAEIDASEAAQTELQAAFDALQEASGELDEIETQIETGTAELTALGERRATAETEAEAELSQLTARIEAARRNFELELAQLTDVAEAARGQTVGAERRLADVQEQVAGQRSDMQELRGMQISAAQSLQEQQVRLGLTETRLREQARALVTVGGRLEVAREQSAQTQSLLADLTEESAQLTSELAEAERRAQRARELEAQMQRELIAARTEFSSMQAQVGRLSREVRELRERREALTTDVATAEQQRTRLQEQIAELTASLSSRSDELRELERRIAELQERGASLAEVGPAPIPPGDYAAGPVGASFAEDGTFSMNNSDNAMSVEGDYAFEQDLLVLSDVTGSTGDATFPVRCRIVPTEDGFRLGAYQDACGALTDMNFVSQEGGQ